MTKTLIMPFFNIVLYCSHCQVFIDVTYVLTVLLENEIFESFYFQVTPYGTFFRRSITAKLTATLRKCPGTSEHKRIVSIIKGIGQQNTTVTIVINVS